VDAKVRFEMVGEQISVDEQILLKHAHTSNWLGSESRTFKNTYGPDMILKRPRIRYPSVLGEPLATPH
jgi:hypothetical protein